MSVKQRLTVFLLVVPTLAVVSANALTAQEARVGAHVSFASEMDFGLGPRVVVPVPADDLQLHVAGSVDYFFPSSLADGVDQSFWEIRATLLLDIPVEAESVAPYAGVGIHYYNLGASVDIRPLDLSVAASTGGFGVDLVAGARFGSGSTGPTPFIELRYDGNEVGQIILSGGVLF